MSEVKIYTAPNGNNYIFWRNQIINIKTAKPFTQCCVGATTIVDFYTIIIHNGCAGLEFPTEAERDDAYDELLTLLEQARKQLAEADAKKSEIEAAKELLKDGERVKIIRLDGGFEKPYFLFRDTLICVHAIPDEIKPVQQRESVLYEFYAFNGCVVFRAHTRKKAERMRNKLIDMLARAKAQLLLEEVGE